MERSSFYKSVYDNLEVDQQESMKSVIQCKVYLLYVDCEPQWGAMGGPEWQAHASPEALEQQKEDGRSYWRTLTEEEHQDIRNAGASWWPNAPMNQRCYSLCITDSEKWRSTLFAQLEGAATGSQKLSLK